MENLTKFDDFKNKKQGNKLNEGVIKIGGDYILSDIAVPVSLVNSYVKKIKDETGKNVREMMSDLDVAYRLGKYCMENYMEIENLPASILLGESDTNGGLEVQETQPAQETPAQESPAQETPAQETQPVQETPAQQTPAQPNAEQAAQNIPSGEEPSPQAI